MHFSKSIILVGPTDDDDDDVFLAKLNKNFSSQILLTRGGRSFGTFDQNILACLNLSWSDFMFKLLCQVYISIYIGSALKLLVSLY